MRRQRQRETCGPALEWGLGRAESAMRIEGSANEDHSDNHERRRRRPFVARIARDTSKALHQAGGWQEPASARVPASGRPAGRRADLTITNRELFFKTEDEYREIGCART